MAAIVLDNLSRVFRGGTLAADRLTLRIPDGRITVVLGPSGAGKTTLLRLIAGLERPDAGTIRMGAHVVNRISPSRRDVAMVFQQFVLFPHWTVRRNIGFSVPQRAERADRVAEVARLLEIDSLLDRDPQSLSGGQQQRVALARAMAGRPATLLLDEPLAHIDAPLRSRIQGVLRQWQHVHQVTVVYVTHDATEARRIADYVVLVAEGRIVQTGTPDEVFGNPVNDLAARWLGSDPSADTDYPGRPAKTPVTSPPTGNPRNHPVGEGKTNP